MYQGLLLSNMAIGPVTRPGAVWDVFCDDVWGDKNKEGTMPHPADTRQHHMAKWIASYFWQIVELLCPTAFFPVNYALPLDRLDVDRLFPSMHELGQAMLTEPWDLKLGERMGVLGDPQVLDHDMWRSTVENGTTVRQRFNFAFAQLPPGDEVVTIWQESKGDQVHTKPMSAGVFIVGGDLGPILGLETQPHFVTHVLVNWSEGAVHVTWQMDSVTLQSLWPTSGRFIFSGVADAGLAEGFISLWQSSTQPFKKYVYSIDCVSSTINPGTVFGAMPWKSQAEVLPCIEESYKWSVQAEQWRRRAMLAVKSRAVHERRSWFSTLFRRSMVSKLPFHGIGLFITGTQAGCLARVIPRPIVSVPLLNLAEEGTHASPQSDGECCVRSYRVQESIMEKWHNRVKPGSVPTHLCDVQDDFKLVEAVAGTDYLAISHRWGEFEDAKLKAAIREVAHELKVQYAWVDTWCIPPDVEKKAFEISKMGDYYSQASAVVVMLLKVKSRTTYTDLKHGVPFNLHKARAEDAALAHEISHSEWRSRVWTIQEGLLAQNCIIKTKDQILDGEYLDHLLHLPDHCRAAQWAALGNTYSKGSPLANVRGVWSSHGFKAYGCTFGNRSWWSNRHQSSVVDVPNKTGLVEALKLGRGRSCAQKVDYVIGLLGLVQGRIPPLAAGRDNWQSIWRKLVQNGVAGPDVLSSERVCGDMCWAPAAIDESNPLMYVAISGETAPQELALTDHGVEIHGTPLKVVVGDDATDTPTVVGPVHNEKHITLIMPSGEELETWAQVPAETGSTFAGIALPHRGLNKGVLILLGDWTHKEAEPLVFRRQSCLNAVRSHKLVKFIRKPQRILLSNN
ncbi:hypothetical protein G7054_g4790 [Neopestalotiopsis clavispora]|nr:hypothetical protein G7054_g4790 [Neopestalotiopsis clavispora]